MDDSLPPVNDQGCICPDKLHNLVSPLKITAKYERVTLGNGVDDQMAYFCFSEDRWAKVFSLHIFQTCVKMLYWSIRSSAIDWYCLRL